MYEFKSNVFTTTERKAATYYLSNTLLFYIHTQMLI